ncbi:FAD-dependent monooxygenase [Nonomuraea sediminis]|uniref:FAD-dependent monooxygenase n=1 Tax=Nonomuraea sediminis TaxID=2835864 RepID=UPI0027E1E2AC|nr:FAD-dependent monooxygenase [Nonomuraea sediminis]
MLIAGGSPVGLATALELAHHGVPSLVVEPREEVSWLRPRAKTTSARSMELFRRWGVAATIRERAPLPVAWSDEAVFVTGLLGQEITRFDRCFGLDLAGDDRAAEPGQQVSQPLVEQMLREAVHASPHARLLTGRRVTGMREDAFGVSVTLDSAEVIRASYVVGCDGSRSVTREAIGARYLGRADSRPNLNIVFRAPGLAERVPFGPAVHYWVLHPSQPGLAGRLDLEETWWCIAQGVTSGDPLEIIRNLARASLDVEVLATDPWTARMLLVDRYSSERIFLAGDSAHQNPPWGGHGFTTGIGDAVNLGWKLAAVINGWAPRSLTATYALERRPIAERTIAEAARNMATLAPELSHPRLDSPSVRQSVAEAVQRAKDSEFHSLDLVLGYTYDGSPIVSGDGARLPHRWLGPGDSLYDHLGPEFTILGREVDGFVKAAADEGVPLTSYDDGLPGLRLVRPDQHVAWSGPDDSHALEILRMAISRAPSTSAGPSPSA